MKISILMTASIDATGCSGARFSASKRLRQYKSAFRFYLKQLRRLKGCQLVFCENTGWDLLGFRAMVPKELQSRVKIVSLPLDGFNKWYGKTYNEMLLIDKALKMPGVFQDSDCVVIKVTGRYPIYNIQKLVEDVECAFNDTITECVCLPAVSFWGRPGMTIDTRCVAFSSSFWLRSLMGTYQAGDKLFFGEIMVKYLSAARTKFFKRPFFIIGEQGGFRRIKGIALPAFLDPPILLVSFISRLWMMRRNQSFNLSFSK